MDASVLAALAAIFVSCVAVGVSVWEGLANRRHNRLSVRPRLVVHYFDCGDRPLTLLLKNQGFGPALITGLTIRRTVDRRVETYSEIIDLARVLGVPPAQAYSFDDGDCLAAGEQLPLLQYDPELGFLNPEREAMIAKLEQVEFQFAYESLYCERFNYNYRVTEVQKALTPA